jgi:predicted sugar kinase
MNVVKSASKSDIESASNVFESAGAGMYTLIKSRNVYGMYVGRTYDRTTAVAFASLNKGTLIIEGGYDMSTESSVNQRTITLVTIPQEVSDAIEWARITDGDSAGIIRRIESPYYSGYHTDALRSIPFETLLSAIVNGYLIEKSAEELAHDAIRTRYLYLKHNAESGNIYAREAYTEMVRTLNTLGIKITEVNA